MLPTIGYPIPVDGPVGEFIRLQGRHNMRPAHLHFMVFKEGCKTHISQVYMNDDVNLDNTNRCIFTLEIHADRSKCRWAGEVCDNRNNQVILPISRKRS